MAREFKSNVSVTGDLTTSGVFSVTAASGLEGGEIRLAPATAGNTTISGNIIIDIYGDKLRFYESSGTNRGYYIDITAGGSTVGTNLAAGGGGGGTASNSFTTIATTSGTSPVADSTTDTLTLSAGTGITVTGDATTDTITIATNGSASNGASTLVLRDSNGNFTANVIYADTVSSSNNGLGTNFKVGDDVWIGDINIANTLRIKGQQNSNNGYIVFGDSDAKALGRAGTGALTFDGNTVWHAGNDGSGSGLDADTLDSYSPATANGASTIVLRDASGNFAGGTITATTFSGSGASLTNIPGANVTGTLTSTVLGNSTAYVGTTAIALNRGSANQALTGISSITLPGSTSGTAQIIPSAVAGTGTVITLPATTGTLITTNDSGTVTNAMLAGSIATDKLLSNAVTIGSTSIILGNTSTTLAGMTGITFSGSTSGTAQIKASAVAGTGTVLTLPATTGTVALTSDIPTVNDATLTIGVSGTGLSISATPTFTANQSTNRTITVTSNASDANGASTLVARDASGNFAGGTITATTFSGSGASLTNIPGANVTGTLTSTVLGNSTAYIGTTAVALNRASGNLALTGISSITLPGSTSGTAQIVPSAVAGTGTVITLPATTGTLITSNDSGTVSNTMLAGSIQNAKLANVSVALGSQTLTLGAAATTSLSGLTSVSSTTFTSTATTGTAPFTVASTTLVTNLNADMLEGYSPASTNTINSIVLRDGSGNFSAGTITASLTGTASNATNVTITNDAATAVAVYPTWVTTNTGNLPVKTTSAALSFVPSTGTLSATVFSGSGASLTSIPAANVTGTLTSTVLGNSTHYIGTTAVALNRASANQALTGISSVTFPGSTSGTILLQATATAGTTTITMPATTGTVALTANKLSDFAATTSAELAGVISNETGSGSLVFGTGPTITPAAAVAATSASTAGYIGMPQNSKSGAYTLVASDAGKHIYYTLTGQTVTIPANSSVAFEIGTTITFITPASVSLSIAITTDTMYLAGTGSTGTRTLAAYGMATAVKVTSTTWIISGNGLT